MAFQPTVGLNILHMLPAFLEEAGVPPTRIFRGVGIADLQAVESGASVRRSQVCAALALSSKALGDPGIALSLGSAADPSKLGANGRALFAGRTVLDGLRAHAQLLPALHSPVKIDLSIEGDEAIWSHQMLGPAGDFDWLLYEGATAFIFYSMRLQLGHRFRPKLVAFPHVRRGKQNVYEDFFDAPVVFCARGSATVTFDSRYLALKPRPAAERERPPRSTETKQDRNQAAFEGSNKFLSDELETIIDAHLGSGELTLPLAARILGLPERSIQRRLARQGLRFETMVDRLREAKARELLLAPHCSVTQVAMELGYSDSAHFIRAFRRWSGFSPTQYRRNPSNLSSPRVVAADGAPRGASQR